MYLSGAIKGVFVLLAVATGRPEESWLKAIQPYSVCSAPNQIICSDDCSELQLCSQDGDDIVPITVDQCNVTNGQMCSEAQGACVAAEDSECHVADQDFKCNDPGAYPDPYDCKVYHVCLQNDNEVKIGHCSGKWAYNPETYDCSLTTSDDVCVDGPVEACEKAGDFGAIKRNQRIYYICVRNGEELYHDMHRCHHGQIFDHATVGCVDPSSQ